jgi:hypothetical protein
MQPPPEKTSLPTSILFLPEERMRFIDFDCCNIATKEILLQNEAQQVPRWDKAAPLCLHTKYMPYI